MMSSTTSMAMELAALLCGSPAPGAMALGIGCERRNCARQPAEAAACKRKNAEGERADPEAGPLCTGWPRVFSFLR
jgi:hypothetical protein